MPTSVWIGFYGATSPGIPKPTDVFANSVLYEIQREATDGKAHMYAWHERDRALNELLKLLDSDHDKVIQEAEADRYRLIIFGYSWGAITAIQLSRFLDDGPSERPQEQDAAPLSLGVENCSYQVRAVPIDLLLVLDPVTFLRERPTGKDGDPGIVVPGNVVSFQNYFQTRGGDGILRDRQGRVARHMGTFISRLLRGAPIAREEPRSSDRLVNVSADPSWAAYVTPERRIGLSRLTARATEVNHDTLPWVVHDAVVRELGKRRAGLPK